MATTQDQLVEAAGLLPVAAVHLSSFPPVRLPEEYAGVEQFGLRVRPVELEIPSTSLRAGSSLRLKNACVQDDAEFGLEVRTQAHQTHHCQHAFPWRSLLCFPLSLPIFDGAGTADCDGMACNIREMHFRGLNDLAGC